MDMNKKVLITAVIAVAVVVLGYFLFMRSSHEHPGDALQQEQSSVGDVSTQEQPSEGEEGGGDTEEAPSDDSGDEEAPTEPQG